MSRHYKIAIVVSIALTAILAVRYVSTRQPKVVKFNPKKDLVVTPKYQNLSDQLTLAGSLKADRQASLTFQTSGKLSWVSVRVGDPVRRGQAIASLDKESLRKNLDKELNDYRSALHNFNDTQDAYKETKDRFLVTDAISRILDRAQYTLNNSVIDYELSELTLKLATLYSPINGIVTNVQEALPGTNVTPLTASYTIIDSQSLYFESEIDQESVTKIKLGQEANIVLDSYPNQNIKTQISYISFTPVVNQTSTVYQVRFSLPLQNDDLSYRLGMDGNTNIILATSPAALSIPTDAVYNDNRQNYVFIKKNNLLVRQNIKIGLQTDTDTEVLAGLSPNDQVVIKK